MFFAASFGAARLALTGCNTTETTASGTATSGAPAPVATAGTEGVPAVETATPVPEGLARVVVYRPSSRWLVPNLMQAMVRLDGAETSPCKLDQTIVRDLAPGAHKVTMQTDIVAKVEVTLAAGETVSFKCLVLPFGLIVNAPLPEQVPTGEVPAEMAAL